MFRWVRSSQLGQTRWLFNFAAIRFHINISFSEWPTYLFVLVISLSASWPIGPSLAPWVLDIYGRPLLNLSDLAGLAMILMAPFSQRNHFVSWGQPYIVPFLALAGLAIITIPFAFLPALAAYTTIRWIFTIAMYVGFVRNNVPIQKIVVVFLIGLSLNSVIGVGQVLAHGPLGLPGELALQPWQQDASIIRIAGVVGIPAYGLTFNPNVLGGYLAIGLLLSLRLLERRGVRLLWWCIWLGLILTFSRSAWVMILVFLPLAAGWLAYQYPAIRNSIGVTLLGAALIGIVAGVVFREQMTVSFHPVRSLISSISQVQSNRRVDVTQAVEPGPMVASDNLRPDASALENAGVSPPNLIQITLTTNLTHRIELWKAAIGVIAARPLTGIGAGNFVPGVPFVAQGQRPNHAHNVPLQLAAELGILGGGLWLWVWMSSALTLYQRRRTLNAWAVCALCAWLGLGLISLYDGYPWVLDSGRLLTITLLGLCSQTLTSVHS